MGRRHPTPGVFTAKRAARDSLAALSLAAACLFGSGAGGGPSDRPDSAYAGGFWLAGDHHIHTRFSSDGMYPIGDQIAHAARYGLSWCVITDHGGPRHDRVALEHAYPELVAARRNHPGIFVFQGLEWNIPAAEHGGVILPIHRDEATTISEFEARFDPINREKDPNPGNSEEDAVAALKHLESLREKPLFFAHHPARRGLDSPHEMRAWADAAPSVARGMEAAPGHQAASLRGGPRGAYRQKPAPAAYRGYPPEAYVTHGGFDWFVARVGGLWDSLLSEARPWYITANSDSHIQYQETRQVDRSNYERLGSNAISERTGPPSGWDFWPGEYTKTIVHADRRDAASILDSLRAGRMFVVLGDLIDRLELSASSSAGRPARMGETLAVARGTRSVEVRLRLHVPEALNAAGKRPRPRSLQLIAGTLRPRGPDADRQEDASARVALTLGAEELRFSPDGWFELRKVLPLPPSGIYLRVRGSGGPSASPEPDGATVDPWDDLWFYSNPIFVRVKD